VSEKKPLPSKATWSPPTRRSFMAMIGAAATALAIRTQAADDATGLRTNAPQKPRWIGHC
jgi:hypothetical protein